jgi:hypothetical protein
MAKGRGRVGDRSSVEGQRRRQARGVDGQGRGGRCLTVNRQVEVANVRQRRAADAAEPWSGRRHEGERTAVGWLRSRRPTDLWGICGRGVNSQKYDVIWGGRCRGSRRTDPLFLRVWGGLQVPAADSLIAS